MGLWAPFVAHAMTTGNALGPYSTAVFLTMGALLSCFIWNIYFMKKPLVGEPVNFSDYFRDRLRPSSRHSGRRDLGNRDGVQPGCGQLYRRRYFLRHWTVRAHGRGPLGRSSWKEFKGAGSKAYVYLFLMFVFYCLAIALVARANG